MLTWLKPTMTFLVFFLAKEGAGAAEVAGFYSTRATSLFPTSVLFVCGGASTASDSYSVSWAEGSAFAASPLSGTSVIILFRFKN